mgnify:CR=1 FL=1|tara:strand:+ start:451 stop:663 length:213 start_codon:yes stop_codon:yes gene_type:complete
MIHFDKYEIINTQKKWVNGKRTKETEVTEKITSEQFITGNSLMNLVDNVNHVWNRIDTKKITIKIIMEEY